MPQLHPIQNGVLMLITTNTMDGEPLFAHGTHAREAIETLYRVKNLHPFDLFGFVIMPDHCHFLLHVAPPETIAKVMSSFKSGVTFNTGIPIMWHRRYHMRIVENGIAPLRYIHMNPVKAGLVRQPEEYPWSSASGEWPIAQLSTYIQS